LKQSITTTRIIGATLLLTLVFAFITAAISGSDTSAEGFGSELIMASILAIALWALITGLWLVLSTDDSDASIEVPRPSMRSALP
jgi:hypothetical protein